MATQKFHDDLNPVEGIDPELALLIAMLEAGTLEQRRDLGPVEDDAITWQPFPSGHSIGAILLHIAGVEAWWFEEVAAGKTLDPKETAELMSDEIDQEAVAWPVPPEKPLSHYYELHDRVRRRSIETLKSLNPRTVADQGTWSASLRWIICHVIIHEAWHLGQAMLLKLEFEAQREK